MFKVGQKVVCVDDGDGGGNKWANGRWLPGETPIVGEVYTIKMMWIDRDSNNLIFEFFELSRPKASEEWGHKVGFGAWRFRPVVERKTDISIFTAMLNPAKAKERV